VRVFVTGCTGVLGRRLIDLFIKQGHAVLGLVRSSQGEILVRSLGAEPVWADLFNADSLARAAERCNVVVHAATSIPTKRKTVPADWAQNDRIRREGTDALTAATSRVGAKLYLQQSVVWVARPRDDSPFDEDAPTVSDPLLQSAIDGEAIARAAGARNGFVVSVLRCGMFYAADAAHTADMLDGLRKRKLPIIGPGDAIWAMIHADDAASAFVAAAEKPQNGIWHIVDDEPVTIRDFLTAFAAKFAISPPRRVPIWLAKLIADEHALAFFTRSTRTANTRFRRDFGWVPRYPSYREGIEQIFAVGNAGRRADSD
jgi:2-alkyl-3-oxoalkanoate reductase